VNTANEEIGHAGLRLPDREPIKTGRIEKASDLSALGVVASMQRLIRTAAGRARCYATAAPGVAEPRAKVYLQNENFDFTDHEKTVREAIAKICTKFPDEYWADCDKRKKWPTEFRDALAEGGWLGMCLPEKVIPL
jgi:hypothetical protein